MFEIFNRDEIKQMLLKELESPDLTEKILAKFENQDYLSKIYDNNRKCRIIDSNHDLLAYGAGYCGGCITIPIIPIKEIFTDAATIITVADLSYKLYKENIDIINNIKLTSSSIFGINIKKVKILNFFYGLIMNIKIRKQEKNDNTNNTDDKN